MPKIPKPTQITGSAVLLVEGIDEVRFFTALLKHLALTDVNILDQGGKRTLKDKFPAALKMPGFSKVQAYAIVLDSDGNPSGAFQSAQNLLRANKQPIPSTPNSFTPGPPKVGVFIMPGTIEGSMLEDLCMGTMADHPVMPCVDAFMACIKDKVAFLPPPDPDAPEVPNYRYPNNAHKARAKVFLVAQEHDLPSVGIAAEAGVWSFDHGCLAGLKGFLQQLVASPPLPPP